MVLIQINNSSHKAKEVLAFLEKMPFVKIVSTESDKLSNKEVIYLKNLSRASKDAKLINSGKKKAKSLSELLDEV